MCEICHQTFCPSGCPNAPEPPVFAECDSCGTEIYDGNEYYEINGCNYCEDCVSDGHKTAEVI